MKDRYAILFLILMGLVFYSLTIRGVLGNPKPEDFKENLDKATKPLELSPERGRFANTLALAEFHTYDLGQTLADAVYPDVGFRDGKYYSLFAPGMSYLVLPFYLLGRYFNLSQVGAFSFVSLVSILNLLLLYGIARKILKLPSWAALAGAMIFGFGATAWSYAITLYQHQLTVFFMFSSFYAAWKFRRQAALGWLWAFWVWLAYGLAITVDYPNAVLLLPVIVYFLASALKAFRIPEGVRLMLRPAALLTVVALFAVFGWNAYHNQENFGSWKRLSGQLPGYRALKESPAEQPPDSTESLNKLAEQQGLQGFFQETNIPFSFYTLTVSPDRGLFFYAPIFILGILGLFLSRKYFSLEKGVLISLAAVNLFLYSSWGDPWGGWAYGPRYLIPSMAVLSLFAGLWLAKTRWQLAGKAAALLLFAYSSAVALLGAITSNAVPPKIEAVDLPLKYYNYFYNLYLLRQNKSGSLLYNIYFSGSVSLGTYFLFIYSAVLLLAAFILFILPRFRHEH